MRAATLLLTAALGACTGSSPPRPPAAPPEPQINLCQEVRVLSEARGVVVYDFTVNEHGAPEKLLQLKPLFHDHEALVACIGAWRFPGVPAGTSMLAIFTVKWGNWKHVSVTGGGYSFERELDRTEPPSEKK